MENDGDDDKGFARAKGAGAQADVDLLDELRRAWSERN